jgi:hypothetical protein
MLTCLRPNERGRIIPIEAHWGRNPHENKPADPDAQALVPVANYGYDSVTRLWLPQPVGSGGAPVVDVQLENEYIMVTVDLSIARAAPTEILYGGSAITGRSLTIWTNNGNFDLYFSDAAHDPIPHTPITWPAQITFVREISAVFVRNTAQASGTQVVFYVGKRV